MLAYWIQLTLGAVTTPPAYWWSKRVYSTDRRVKGLTRQWCARTLTSPSRKSRSEHIKANQQQADDYKYVAFQPKPFLWTQEEAHDLESRKDQCQRLARNANNLIKAIELLSAKPDLTDSDKQQIYNGRRLLDEIQDEIRRAVEMERRVRALKASSPDLTWIEFGR